MAIKHLEHIQWVNGGPRPLQGVNLQILEELLVKSPALEVSCRSVGFINRFGVRDSDDAEVFFGSLMSGVNYLTSDGSRFALNADEVERLLSFSNLLEGEFWSAGEFAVYTVPNEAKTQIKKYVDLQTSANQGLKRQKIAHVQAKYLQLDSLFRHLRNAIAHGAFQRFQDNGYDRYVFQDGNKNGDLSARIVLDASRLDGWISMFYQLEHSGV